MASISVRSETKEKQWVSKIPTAMVTLILLGSGVAKIARLPIMVDGLIQAGIPHGAILPIALVELSCMILYLVPRTSILGTFLLTGYFGGATVTHIIGGESFFPPLAIGLWIWGAAYLRNPELRSLIPLKKENSND